MKLYLEKRGMDLPETIPSDLQSYRLFLEYIARDGRRICGDIFRGAIRDGKRILTDNALYTDLQYENYTGTYCYNINAGFTPLFTKADALRLINADSAVQYDAVEIVDRLPDAAHDYPEDVRALERRYLADQHAKKFNALAERIRNDCFAWLNASDFAFDGLTDAEYRTIVALAFDGMVTRYGVVETGERTGGSLISRTMTKHFFEEQGVVDPYADQAFIKELRALAPYHVGRYVPFDRWIDMELDEFAELYAPDLNEDPTPAEKLTRALKRAGHAARLFADEDDGGTCNFDAPVLDYAACGLKERDAVELIESLGLSCYDWKPFRNHRGPDGKMIRAPKYLVINGFQHGQGNRRTKMAEAFCQRLIADGIEAGMYYQMD